MDTTYLPYSSIDESIHDQHGDQSQRSYGDIHDHGSQAMAFGRVASLAGQDCHLSFAQHINDEQMKRLYMTQWNNSLAMDPSQLQLGMASHGDGHASLVQTSMPTHGYHHHDDENAQVYAACSPDCDEECKSQCGGAGELDICEDPRCDDFSVPCTREDCEEPSCDDDECLATCTEGEEAAAVALASIVGSQAAPSPSADGHLATHAHASLDLGSPKVDGSTLMDASHEQRNLQGYMGTSPDDMLGQDMDFSNVSFFPSDLGIQLNLLGDAVLHHMPTSTPHIRPCPWDKQPAMTQICRFPRPDCYSPSIDLGAITALDPSSLCGAPYYSYEDLLEHCSSAHPQALSQVQTKYVHRQNVNEAMGGILSTGQASASSLEGTPEIARLRAETVTPSAAPSPMHSATPGTRDSVESFSSPGAQGPHICKWQVASGGACGQIFDTEDELHQHAMDHSKVLKKPNPLRCLWMGCSREDGEKGNFSQRSKLERHLQTHTGFKPFKCDICGLPLSGQQALTQHKRTHTDEKPWKCAWEGCDKSFRAQSALKMHERTHTGEKSLLCPICGKGFSESSNLSKHKKTHVRGFQCHICDKHFSRNDQLKNHLKIHEAVEVSGPEAFLSKTKGGRISKG